jgi:hypothetical protein
VLPAEQRRHLERLLHRGQSRILRTLVRLAEQQATAGQDGNEADWADLITGPAGPEG